MDNEPIYDLDLFFRAHDLGATEQEALAIAEGRVPLESLLPDYRPPPQPYHHPHLLQTLGQANEPTTPPPAPSVALPETPTLQKPVVQPVAPPPQTAPVYVEPETVTTPPPPAAKVTEWDPPIGSWLIEEEDEDEEEATYQVEEQAMNGAPTYPQFVSPEQALGWGVGMAVSTATEKLFGKDDGGNAPAKLARVRRAGRRRRRRRLLTCSDKADIAYLVGQLGQGQLGKAAISALLSRRCG